MSRRIFCKKLNQEAEGLERPPIPGQLGQKIFEEISQLAWQQWIAHQTMLINEYRLSMLEAKSRQFLMQEMQNFLFGDGSEKPPGFVAS